MINSASQSIRVGIITGVFVTIILDVKLVAEVQT